jgi:hypothetical protein
MVIAVGVSRDGHEISTTFPGIDTKPVIEATPAFARLHAARAIKHNQSARILTLSLTPA